MTKKLTEIAVNAVVALTGGITLTGLFAGAISPEGAMIVAGGLLISSAVYFGAISEHHDVCPDSVIFVLFVSGVIPIVSRVTRIDNEMLVAITTPHEDVILTVSAALALLVVAAIWYVLEVVVLPSMKELQEAQKNTNPHR